MDNKKKILTKVYLFFFAIAIFGIAVFAQIINIQFFKKEEIIKNVAITNAGYRKVPATRGDIYAYDGSLLATSLDIYTVGMDLSSGALTDENFNKYLEPLCDSLHALLPKKTAKKYRDELINARKKRVKWYKIDDKMSYLDFKRLQKFPLFELGKYKSGLAYSKEIKRKQPFGVLAFRTIGSRAPYGLEGAFDNYLRGKDGEQYQRKIAGGIWVSINDQNSIEPINGYDVLSTIDIGIQEIVENELKNRLIYHKADHGCAVLMEVKTGKVRAIANLKIDSLNNFWEAKNYAVGDAEEPGSTFKLASMMALLEDGLISLDDVVNVGYGVTTFYDKKMKDSHPYSYNRDMTVREIFHESSNVGIAKLIVKHYGRDPQKFIDRLYGFGLQSKLELDIKGEQAPRIKDPSDKNNWSGITLPWSSIGYEVALTPMQILAFYNGIANNGKVVRPYFVEQIKTKEKIIAEYGTQIINHAICSKSTLKTMQELLKGVVKEGTAMWAFNGTAYTAAGKTGTSQMNYGNRKEGDGTEYRASFVGYFPAENPVYSCIVVISNPRVNGFYGSVVAAPVFRKISDKLFTTCSNLHIDVDTLKNNHQEHLMTQRITGKRIEFLAKKFGFKSNRKILSDNWLYTKIENKKLKVIKEENWSENRVPNVVNMPLHEAIYLLENRGLRVKLVGQGKIVQQSLLPGERVNKGTVIKLILG